MKADYGQSKKKIEQAYKSKGEVQIARLLQRNRIAYKYEYPLAVVDQGKTKIWYPDFYLPEYAMIIEYFGMNGNSSYDEQARKKLEVYKKTGIEGLFLKSDSLKGDWPNTIMRQIEDILKNRLDRFYDRNDRK